MTDRSVENANMLFAAAVTEAQFEYATSGHTHHVHGDEAEEMIVDIIKGNEDNLSPDEWLKIAVIALAQVARRDNRPIAEGEANRGE